MTWRSTLVVTAVLSIVACGGSGSSPTAPSPYVPPTSAAILTPLASIIGIQLHDSPPPGLTVTNLAVSAAATILAVGQTTTVTATATYSDGTTATVAPTWSSTNTYSVTVTSGGVVTALGTASFAGEDVGFVASHTVGINASMGGQNVQINITVTPATVTGVTINTSSASLSVGQTTTVTATATYTDGTTPTVSPTWVSSNTAVATVSSSGTVTTIAAGSATITGAYEGQSDSVGITVTAAIPTVTGITVSASTSSLQAGQTATVTATATYSDGTTATVASTWSSSDTAVATVSSSGTVTAVAAGSATISGANEGQSGSVGITVPLAVTNLEVCCFTTLTPGQTTTVTATATYSDGTTATVTPIWSTSGTGYSVTVNSEGVVTAITTASFFGEDVGVVGASYTGIRANYGGQTHQINMKVIPCDGCRDW